MTRPRRSTGDVDVTAAAVVAIAVLAVAVTGMLWAGGALGCLITGRGLPHTGVLAGLRTLAHPGEPSRAWHTPMCEPLTYWICTAVVTVAVVALAVFALPWWRRAEHRPARADLAATPGLATRRDIRSHLSERALLPRAPVLRPTLTEPGGRDLGYRLGTSRGLAVWISVEDSVLIVGPPRSGKGLHLVIPMIRDAPGPVITTSTRPDNVTATLPARAKLGPVAVFDPQGLAPTLSGALRWSPVRGCADPQTAMIRARALAAGGADQVENRGFWQAQTETALRTFLHAAAHADLDAVDLYRWSLDPAAAGEAVRILHATPRAALGWADALDAIISGEPRTRDNSWAGVRTALSCLADPRVLDAVTPQRGQHLDPSEFLTGHGTLYLLGTASGAGAAANLVAALLEDIVHTARRCAAAAPYARLDPPLALILDEAANYALPSLPALISEGGGTGITTVAVLQSLAQARGRWGEHDGTAIWDATSVKIILGGGSNARDLHDLAALIGDRDEPTQTHSRDADGRRTTSESTRRIPVLDSNALRTVPFGNGVMLHRAIAPVIVELPTPSTAADQRRLTTAQ